MSESYNSQTLSGWIKLQILQLAQIPELQRDRSAKLVRGQIPITTRVSESYNSRIPSGWVNLQGLQLAQVPELRQDRSNQLVRGQAPIPTKMSVLQFADSIGMSQLTDIADESDSQAPLGPFRSTGSRTSPYFDDIERSTIRSFDPDGSTYRVCSWLMFPSSCGIIPLNWFQDKPLFRRE